MVVKEICEPVLLCRRDGQRTQPPPCFTERLGFFSRIPRRTRKRMLKLPAVFAGMSLIVFGVMFRSYTVCVFGGISLLVGFYFLSRDF
jgi:hypothetical protein